MNTKKTKIERSPNRTKIEEILRRCNSTDPKLKLSHREAASLIERELGEKYTKGEIQIHNSRHVAGTEVIAKAVNNHLSVTKKRIDLYNSIADPFAYNIIRLKLYADREHSLLTAEKPNEGRIQDARMQYQAAWNLFEQSHEAMKRTAFELGTDKKVVPEMTVNTNGTGFFDIASAVSLFKNEEAAQKASTPVVPPAS